MYEARYVLRLQARALRWLAIRFGDMKTMFARYVFGESPTTLKSTQFVVFVFGLYIISSTYSEWVSVFFLPQDQILEYIWIVQSHLLSNTQNWLFYMDLKDKTGAPKGQCFCLKAKF